MSLEKLMAIIGKGKKTVGKAAETAKGVLKSRPVESAAAGGAAAGAGLTGLAELLGGDDEGEEDGMALEKFKKRKKIADELC